jgi:hypothetical protein
MRALIIPFSSMNLCDAAAAAVCGRALSNGRSIFDLLYQLVQFATPRVTESFVLVIAAIEFAPTWKNAYYVESRGIPDDDDHRFSALNRETCPLRTHPISSDPRQIKS